MRLWRISNYNDLSGEGGFRGSARWHNKGRPIIYASEHPAGALSEMLAHIDLDDFPGTFQLITIDIEADVQVITIEPLRLPPGWTTDAGATRAIGDNWLAAGASLLLRVPSAIIPDAWNMLVNPGHPDASRMRIVKTEKVPLDRRLIKR